MSVDSQWERYTTSCNFAPGEPIFKEGDPSDEMYIVSEGRLAITKDVAGEEALVLAYCQTGDLMGEISLLSDSPRTASAVAVEPTTLRVISRDNFWRLMREDVDFQQTVIHTLIEQLLAADRSRMSAAVWERELHQHLTSLSSEHERLAELMKLRQETMRFIVHDLRNPLHIVMMALGVIKQAHPDPEGETARFTAMAEGGVQRVLSLVNALLDLERLESGEVTLELEPVDMIELVEGSVERNQPMAEACALELALAPSGETLPLMAVDRQRMERVITNLIDNAVKFTPPEGKVAVSVEREDDKLVVIVNDTGLGIPPEERERIFERFTQTEAGRQKKQGFGLGLTYCRTVVVAHGGHIWAEEGEGGLGTKMMFTLPIDNQ